MAGYRAGLGARDLSASLDLWLTDAEIARMDAALDVICGCTRHHVGCSVPLEALVLDDDGDPRLMLRRHWHPQQGWGWQLRP